MHQLFDEAQSHVYRIPCACLARTPIKSVTLETACDLMAVLATLAAISCEPTSTHTNGRINHPSAHVVRPFEPKKDAPYVRAHRMLLTRQGWGCPQCCRLPSDHMRLIQLALRNSHQSSIRNPNSPRRSTRAPHRLAHSSPPPYPEEHPYPAFRHTPRPNLW